MNPNLSYMLPIEDSHIFFQIIVRLTCFFETIIFRGYTQLDRFSSAREFLPLLFFEKRVANLILVMLVEFCERFLDILGSGFMKFRVGGGNLFFRSDLFFDLFLDNVFIFRLFLLFFVMHSNSCHEIEFLIIYYFEMFICLIFNIKLTQLVILIFIGLLE